MLDRFLNLIFGLVKASLLTSTGSEMDESRELMKSSSTTCTSKRKKISEKLALLTSENVLLQ